MESTLKLSIILFLSVSTSIPFAHCSYKWITTNSTLPRPLQHHSAVYDEDDSIYLIGGWIPPYNYDVVKYVISTGAASTISRVPVGFYEGAAVLDRGHGEDEIVLMGGFTSEGNFPSPTMYRFQVSSGTFGRTSYFPHALTRMAAVWNAEARIAYTFGGWSFGAYHDEIYQYDASTVAETVKVGTLPQGRSGATAVWARDGNVYIFGGETQSWGESLHDVHQFNPSTGRVIKLPAARLPVPILDTCSVRVQEHAYVISGGHLLRFDPEQGQVEDLEVDPASWPTAIGGAGCVYIEKLNRIYVIGGVAQFNGEMEERRLADIAYINLGTEDDGGGGNGGGSVMERAAISTALFTMAIAKAINLII